MDIIVTPRLILRSPLPHDLRDLHDHILSDPDVMRFAFAGEALSRAQSEAFFAAHFDHDLTGKKLGILTERETRRFIGFAGLMACDALGQVDYELGFMLRTDAWGRGYASEIGTAQMHYGLVDLGLRRVLAQVSPHHSAYVNPKLRQSVNGPRLSASLLPVIAPVQRQVEGVYIVHRRLRSGF